MPEIYKKICISTGIFIHARCSKRKNARKGVKCALSGLARGLTLFVSLQHAKIDECLRTSSAIWIINQIFKRKCGNESPGSSYIERTLCMKHCLFIPLAFFTLAIGRVGAADKTQKVPERAKVFISPMEGDLHPFIAEIVKKKLPVVVVTEEKDADFILSGASIKGDDKWFHTIFGGKDKNEGSVQLISVKEKTMVCAGEAGDRSLLWGGWKRGGQRKVADRIVNK
jgi:hypothetical protein